MRAGIDLGLLCKVTMRALIVAGIGAAWRRILGSRVLRWAPGLAFIGVLLCACADGVDDPLPAAQNIAAATLPSTATATVTRAPVATMTATAVHTHSASPTATAAPSPTPTPTALPVLISGNLRRATLMSAVSQSGAPCGVVDLLDYPLNPPNAENIIRGHDFGQYRSYYGGYHTGEDWWGPGGRSLGLQVHSIGHGVVTHAAPRGWGTDGGTVVVEHVLSEGSTILSFYGHLEPSSVVLRAGDCVTRGEVVGRIGQPSSPPHLHFEIRRHTPNGPGPGYWPSDPSLAGWDRPSQVIWDQRVASAPGVVWTRPSADWRGTTVLTMLDDDTVVVSEDGRLLGISVFDGDLRWSQTSSIRATHGAIDIDQSMLYTANQYTGRVEAFHLQERQPGGGATGSDSPLVPAWESRLDASGSVTLVPLPNGGVVASFRQRIFGVSALGRLLWTHDSPGLLLDWVLLGGRVLVSTTGEDASVWEVDETGMSMAAVPVSGQVIIRDDQLVVFGDDGLYSAGPDTSLADLLYALPKRRLEQGDLVALSDGGFLLVHTDSSDRRLITLNRDGTLRWQRSVARTLRSSEYHLLMVDGYPLVVSHRRSASSSELSIFGVDLDRAMLVRLFAAEGWTPRPGDSWAYPIGDNCVLLNIGSGTGRGRLVALDIRLALESVTRATTTQ